MSNPTPILASAVPFAISTTSDTTGFKNVVCKKTWGLKVDNTLVQEETDCGVISSLGASKISFDFEFILNTTPNGATEWGSDDVMNMANNKTLIYVKTTSGAAYYREIAGYISNYEETAAQGGVINAKGTFQGTGILDTSA